MIVQKISQAEFSYSDDHRNNRKHAVAHPVLKLLPLVGLLLNILFIFITRVSHT
jgi:hypothetical protein